MVPMPGTRQRLSGGLVARRGEGRLIENEARLERTLLKTFWLIVQDAGDRPKVFEPGTGRGERSLPIFSFEEEALLFLSLGGLEEPWRTRETDAAELALALTGPYRVVQRVVLDPFPEVGLRGYPGDLRFGREEFVDLLAFGRRFRPRTASGPSVPGRRAFVPPGTPS